MSAVSIRIDVPTQTLDPAAIALRAAGTWCARASAPASR